VYEEFSQKLGCDFYIGLPEEHLNRAVPLFPTDPSWASLQSHVPASLGRKMLENSSQLAQFAVVVMRMFFNPNLKKKAAMMILPNVDLPKVRQGEIPGANGNATA